MSHTGPVSLLVLVIAVLVTACAGGTTPGSAAPAASPPASAAAQGTADAGAAAPTVPQAEADSVTDDGGGVTVRATWAGIGAGAVFELALDTHSVDLDPLDLRDGILRNDRGQTMTTPSWSAPPAGHHRSGELRFAGDGQTFFASAKWIELVLFGIGDVAERTLRWDVGS